MVLIMKYTFQFFRQTLQKWLVKKIGGGQPSAVPVQCCVRIFSGLKCLRFPLSPVYSQLNFILMASVPTMEMRCPSILSRTVMVAWSGPLCLVLKTHDRRTLSIDLPTSITIPIFHRLKLKQLSAPTEYMLKDDVIFNIVLMIVIGI